MRYFVQQCQICSYIWEHVIVDNQCPICGNTNIITQRIIETSNQKKEERK